MKTERLTRDHGTLFHRSIRVVLPFARAAWPTRFPSPFHAPAAPERRRERHDVADHRTGRRIRTTQEAIRAGVSLLAISLTGAALAQGVPNTSNVDGSGTNDTAIVTNISDGFGNTAALSQSGSGSGFNLLQNGARISAIVLQSSNDNLSAITRTGSGSTESVTQTF